MRIFAATRAERHGTPASFVVLSAVRDNSRSLAVPDLIGDDDWRTRQRGFTLVELMMVLAVLALAATVVLLTLPSASSRVTGEADRLAARIAALRDLAIVEGRPMAVTVRASGYDFEGRTGDGWAPLAGRPFAAHDWPRGVRLVPGEAAVQRIEFNPLGMTDARRTLVVSDGDVTAPLRVSATGEVVRGE